MIVGIGEAFAREPVGAYGALVATLVLLWNIASWLLNLRESRRKERTLLRVDWQFSEMVHGETRHSFFHVKVVNESQHEVEITSMGVEYPGIHIAQSQLKTSARLGHIFIPSVMAQKYGMGLPQKVPSRQATNVANDTSEVCKVIASRMRRGRVRLRAYVVTSSGRIFRSNYKVSRVDCDNKAETVSSVA